MASREIVLWLDERWYDALERHLGGETLKEKMNDSLDELINRLLPDDEYERISREIFREQAEEDAKREAARRYAVFRVRENGRQHCCFVDEPIGILQAARALRSYVRSESDSGFQNYFAAAQPITAREFTQYAKDRYEGSSRVVGVFDVDLDGKQFATLEAEKGWYAYAVKDVSAAVYRADRRSYEPDDERSKELLACLHGKWLPLRSRSPEERVLRGTRELEARDVSFADEVSVIGSKLDFYLESFDGLDEVFGTHVCTAENDDYVNAYADYDLDSGTVSNALVVVLHRGDGRDEAFDYPLSEREQAILLPKMDAYCREQTGLSLEAYRNRYLAEQQEAPQMSGAPTM